MKKLLILLLLFNFSCSPKIKKTTNTESAFDAIEVTANGGFAGTMTGFSIQRNAEIYVLFHKPGQSYHQKLYRVSTEDSVQAVFEKIRASGVSNENYYQPGNLTYSIVLRKDTLSHGIHWSDGQDSIKHYQELYRYLRKFASGRE